ncbi:hypothetical protein HNQ57_003419 [Zhongshania antarctica]|uniref:Uncharacterized protein n=1 Tax=Zhongshania antarctica TaxID=641702 RepID=A0A840R743_9GAMM|nr:hypothetical protein [Zhongshania antarctica]MBB5189119.1 hypothetical protein [Zhongshania antarctica]
MNELPDDHKGHTIIPSASGPTGGPWVGNYSVWKIEPNNNYTAVLQGFISGEFATQEGAISTAVLEAKSKIDAL